MKKQKLLFIFGTSLILASCGADSEADIVNDIEAQQSEPEFHYYPKPASIRDQNKEKIPENTALESYGDEAGHYISETTTLLETMASLFEQRTVHTTDVQTVLTQLEELREKSSSFIDLDRPQPFDGLHHVHLSTLIEIDALERVLLDMKEPIHPLQVTNARVYYENAVMSHKLMEREYLSITEELGIH
ncbi:hypothetical protein ACFFHM_06600 [Halalkalibacter kiskunsagensis]|uniref:Uncharacterized protein n=1 Tax=Halalkalibacter kiskunsagensis TaxID=1548599 RepID=A0ABV6KDS1_9BACI